MRQWAVAAVALCAAISLSFFLLKERERRLRLVAEEKLAESLRLNDGFRLKLSEAMQSRGEMEALVGQKEARLAELSAELESTRSELEGLKSRAETDRAERENTLKEREYFTAQLKARDEHIRRILAELVTKRNVSGGVNLGSVVVGGGSAAAGSAENRPKQAPPPAPLPTLTGKVVAVNSEFDFIVTDLGSDDGLRKGARMWVLRKNAKIAVAEAEMVQEAMSAAAISSEFGGPVKIGDTIETSPR